MFFFILGESFFFEHVYQYNNYKNTLSRFLTMDICALRDMFAQGEPEKKSESAQQFTPASIGKGNLLPDKVIPKAKALNDTDECSDVTKDIWGDQECVSSNILEDKRIRPECTDTYLQTVGSEDIFLGMGTKDPGTSTSDGLRVSIHLPLEDSAANIELDLSDMAILLSSKN